MVNPLDVVNGSFWIAKRSESQAVGLSVWVQYIDGDQFILLAHPETHDRIHRGFYLSNTSPYVVNGFPVIMTREELVAALRASFAERENRFLAVVDAVPDPAEVTDG